MSREFKDALKHLNSVYKTDVKNAKAEGKAKKKAKPKKESKPQETKQEETQTPPPQ